MISLRRKNLDLATEVVQDLKDLEQFGLSLPEKRLHKIRGTALWELRSAWRHSIARTLFFEEGRRVIVVTHIFQKKTDSIPTTDLKRALERMERWLEERR
ncbi:MAG: type II toxin-antitoxin system RelE/ParE family toxin [Actinomycetota bacterium]|nr:type II toxin-antitoxin system RelE/ParE family toxin [Actinomycetota bacterium]